MNCVFVISFRYSLTCSWHKVNHLQQKGVQRDCNEDGTSSSSVFRAAVGILSLWSEGYQTTFGDTGILVWVWFDSYKRHLDVNGSIYIGSTISFFNHDIEFWMVLFSLRGICGTPLCESRCVSPHVSSHLTEAESLHSRGALHRFGTDSIKQIGRKTLVPTVTICLSVFDYIYIYLDIHSTKNFWSMWFVLFFLVVSKKNGRTRSNEKKKWSWYVVIIFVIDDLCWIYEIYMIDIYDCDDVMLAPPTIIGATSGTPDFFALTSCGHRAVHQTTSCITQELSQRFYTMPLMGEPAS